MPTIVLTTHGTGGDILPFVRIGRALVERGHAVTLISHCAYEAPARAAGLQFAPFDTPAEYQQMMEDQHLLRNPLSRPDDLRLFYQRNDLFARTRREFDLIGEHSRAGGTVVLTRHTSGLAGLMAAERHGLPLVTLALAPYQFAALTLAEDVYRHVLGAGINALRAGVGLGPIRHWRTWLNSAPRHVALWPDWFAAADETWPVGTIPAGFIPGDEGGELPEALLRGLKEGAAPVLITGGTGSLVPRAFYEVAAEACRRLGRRGILVTRYADLMPAGLPDTIEWYSALPFARLMPAMGAVIHHGGIGTAGRALLSGTPQLVLPDTGDRPDNAARLAQLGVAEVLLPREWQPDRVAAALARLLEAPAVRARCDELRQRAARDDPALAVCRAAEAALAEGPCAGSEPAGEPTARDDLRERLRNLSPAQQAALAERLKHRG